MRSLFSTQSLRETEMHRVTITQTTKTTISELRTTNYELNELHNRHNRKEPRPHSPGRNNRHEHVPVRVQ